MKRLLYRLLISKKRRFEDNLEHEGRHGIILEVDTDRQWFAAVVHYTLDELKEGGAPNLILFQRKRLSPIARMRLVVMPEKSELFIGDFTSDIQNKGYGSILLRNVIKLAGLLESDTITGNLSAVDLNNFDKLKYLYSKYGFEVNIKGNNGTIIRRMK